MFLSIVTFYGAGLDDDGCVTFLVVLTLVRNRPYHVATRQTERRSECSQRCDQHGDDDLDNLLLAHSA